ncbi:hypothetical protein BH18ACT15_BH18ACT15_03840 [soil metagenome]
MKWYAIGRRLLRPESIKLSLSPTRRVRTERLLAVSGVLFGLILALRFAVSSPDDELVLLLCVVPISLVAMALGTMGGLGAAGLSYASFITWVVIQNANFSLLDHLARALAFFFVGGLVGYFTTLGRKLEEQDSRWFDLSLDIAATAGFDGYFKRVNPAFERILGYKQGELLRQPFLDLVHPGDRETTQERAAELSGGRDVVGFHNRYRAKDGSYHWIEWMATAVISEQLIYAAAHDITARKAAEEQLQEAEERFRTAFEEAPIGMALVDMDGRWLQANGALCRLTGYSLDALLSVGFQDITHPDDLAADEEQAKRLRDGSIESYRLEKRFIHAEGHPVWVSFNSSLVRMPGGPPLYLISQVEDISKRKELEAELRHVAQHDPLTGLFNRQRFAEELSRQLAHVARYQSSGALFILDLDNFKQINDSHGHAAGDAVLREVADILRRSLRATDIPARLGGDEFAVLLPEADVKGAALVAGKLLAAVRDRFADRRETAISVTLSIGVAFVDAAAASSSDLATIMADHAMYDAKRQGGNRFSVYNEERSSHYPTTYEDRAAL